MAVKRRSPGAVRDAIVKVMHGKGTMTTVDIHAAVCKEMGEDVPPSSVRSYLRLAPRKFDHLGRGLYRLRSK